MVNAHTPSGSGHRCKWCFSLGKGGNRDGCTVCTALHRGLAPDPGCTSSPPLPAGTRIHARTHTYTHTHPASLLPPAPCAQAMWAYGPVTSYSLSLREIDTVQAGGGAGTAAGGAAGAHGGGAGGGGASGEAWVPSVIETIVRKGHLDALGDPLVQTLLHNKWERFAKVTFVAQTTWYLVWVISQTFLVWMHCDKASGRRALGAVCVLGVRVGARGLDGGKGRECVRTTVPARCGVASARQGRRGAEGESKGAAQAARGQRGEMEDGPSRPRPPLCAPPLPFPCPTTCLHPPPGVVEQRGAHGHGGHGLHHRRAVLGHRVVGLSAVDARGVPPPQADKGGRKVPGTAVPNPRCAAARVALCGGTRGAVGVQCGASRRIACTLCLCVPVVACGHATVASPPSCCGAPPAAAS